MSVSSPLLRLLECIGTDLVCGEKGWWGAGAIAEHVARLIITL
ncbi:MAG: hypothetical protein ACFB12_24920 [Leptolyngbyaceae cyanobacterium]